MRQREKTRVKICGLKSVMVAQKSAEYGADMLGLVFAPSKRQVDIATAKKIRRAVSLPLVGVFKGQTLAEILAIAQTCQLDIIQLHGNEPAEFLQQLDFPVIRSVAVSEQGFANFAFERWRSVHGFLLDTALADGSSGGAGKVFPWKNISLTGIPSKIFVAGGLNPENVQEAIKVLKPYAVDVSGGVEVQGEKSPELIKNFISKVKNW